LHNILIIYIILSFYLFGTVLAITIDKQTKKEKKMKTIKKSISTTFENIITLMDRFPCMLSLLLTMIIVVGVIR
jgi:hypothetical protein